MNHLGDAFSTSSVSWKQQTGPFSTRVGESWHGQRSVWSGESGSSPRNCVESAYRLLGGVIILIVRMLQIETADRRTMPSVPLTLGPWQMAARGLLFESFSRSLAPDA